MELFNNDPGVDEIITSRYTIVIAASKRARQLIDGSPTLIPTNSDKSVSVAVNEMYAGKLRIIPSNNDGFQGMTDELVIREASGFDYNSDDIYDERQQSQYEEKIDLEVQQDAGDIRFFDSEEQNKNLFYGFTDES